MRVGFSNDNLRKKILAGEKKQTICRGIKRYSVGQQVIFWVGNSNTKNGTYPFTEVIIKHIDMFKFKHRKVTINDIPVNDADALLALAQSEGFANTQELYSHLESNYGGNFRGTILHWDGLLPVREPMPEKEIEE